MPTKPPTVASPPVSSDPELDKRLLRYIVDSKTSKDPPPSFKVFCATDRDFFGVFVKDKNSTPYKRRKKVANRYSKLLWKHDNNFPSFLVICRTHGVQYSPLSDSSDDSSTSDRSEHSQDGDNKETVAKSQENSLSNLCSLFSDNMSHLGAKLNQRLLRK